MLELAICSSGSELAAKLVDDVKTAGHTARFLDVSGDWVAELDGNPVAVVLLDVAADAERIKAVSAQVRKTASMSRLRQIAVVDAQKLGEVSIPSTVDEVAVYPFRPGELAAKLRLLEESGRTPSATTLVFGNVAIDTTAYEVTLDGVQVPLTFKEQELLHFLAAHPDQVFSRSQLLSEVWGYDYFGGTRTVDVHVRRLRFKLGASMAARIQTVRNVGYKFTSHI